MLVRFGVPNRHKYSRRNGPCHGRKRHDRVVFMMSLLCVSKLLGLVLAATVGLTEPELAAALRGEVPTRSETQSTDSGQAKGQGIGAVVIDRPLAEVWAVVSHFEDKAEYMPRLEKVEVLEKSPRRLRARMTVDASVKFARYTAVFVLDPDQHTIVFSLDKTAPDNTIKDTSGGYSLFEVSAEKTLVVYRSSVDTGLKIPRFIADYMSRRSIPNLLRAIKKRVETRGLYRK